MQDLVTLDAGLQVVYVSMDSLPNIFSHEATLGHARSSTKNCKGDRPHMFTGVNPFKTFYILLQWEEFNEGAGNKKVKKKNSRFNKQNNNIASASHFFVHFFPFFAPLRRENAFFRVL